MVQDFKHSLRFTLFMAFFCIFSNISAAQEIKVEAVPPTEVFQEELAPPDPRGVVVVELFTSQACAFCPKADAYLDELAEKDNVIALACHVDYHNDKSLTLAKPFCTQRQNQYARTLRSGPRYTPQMILNGEFEAIGHKKEKISNALYRVASNDIASINIKPVNTKKYRLTMPDIDIGQYAIWVAILDKPVRGKILRGKSKGKEMVYNNVVSSMVSPFIWDGQAKALDLSAVLGSDDAGVAVFAQNQIDGHIVAAGQFKL